MEARIALAVEIEGQWAVTHFYLNEFARDDGWAMIDPSVVRSLELTRRRLNRDYRGEVQIIVTDATRTEFYNQVLGQRLGWTDEGGLVARDSRHLEKYGGIAVDIRARVRKPGRWVEVRQSVLARACRYHFDFVKADYEDGHVHADNRNQAKG